MRFRRFVAVVSVLLAASAGYGAERVTLTVLSTTDLHGHILPVDYYTNRPTQDGVAKLATIIKRVRAESPHVVLLDSGDTIQGTPLAYFHNRKNNTPIDPMMLVMNALGYDAMAIGNHEYNFGRIVLEKARGEAKFPWLSANTYRVGTEEPAYAPYVVKEMAGVRVGILGFTTPGVPHWEDPVNYKGLQFRDPVAEAQKWVPILRGQERADVVLVPMHMGIERDPRTGEIWPGQVPNENAALAIAEAVPGIDAIFMGHTHRNHPTLEHHGVLFTQAGRWGDRIARADLTLEKTDGAWRVVEKNSRTIEVAHHIEPDPEIVALAEPYDRETQEWLAMPIGECAAELTSRESRLRDTAIMDLIHRVQLDVGQADVSMAASFSLSATIPQGIVTVRDIAGIYVYENTLVVIEATGRQLKEALEHSAEYFRPYQSGRSPRELVDPRIPGYNFDMAEGVEYEIDIRKRYGERITNLRLRGEPLDPARKLKLAINNYRLNGGGGYVMYQGSQVIYRSSSEVRDLIIDWVERHKVIPAEPNHNWRLLPEE